MNNFLTFCIVPLGITDSVGLTWIACHFMGVEGKVVILFGRKFGWGSLYLDAMPLLVCVLHFKSLYGQNFIM
jgi:hypothetical protein